MGRRILLVAIALASLPFVPPQPVNAAPAPVECARLAHVGDSLTAAAESQLAAQYARRGWSDVRIDAKGGRSIAGFMYVGGSGLDVVRRAKKSGFDGCWVMALGTNDTANADENGAAAATQRRWRMGLIRSMMDELGGAPVMWVNVHLVSPTAAYSTADAAAWNQALRDVAGEYPNMMIYDFDAAAAGHREWTDADQVHDTPLGSTRRAELVARAATVMLGGSRAAAHRANGWSAFADTASEQRRLAIGFALHV